MKTVSAFIFVAILGAYGTASALSSIDQIEEIDCTDANPTQTMKIYLNTTGSGAQKFDRRPGRIVTEFANLQGRYVSFKVSLMELRSDSDLSNRHIILFENDYYSGMQVLDLRPTSTPQQFKGIFSGSVYFYEQEKWGKVQDRELNCTLKFL